MGFIATAKETGDFRLVPPGNHIARCYSLIDLGRQVTNWQGQEKIQHKILVGWELFGEDNDGNPLTVQVDGSAVPMTITKRYSLTLSKNSHLRTDLESWRGRPFSEEDLQGFHVDKLLGVYCMLNVTHEQSKDGTKTYANVSAITPLPSALKNAKPSPVHEIRIFDLDNPDMGIFVSLSDRLQEIIKSSPDWIDNRQQSQPQVPAMGADGNPIPF